MLKRFISKKKLGRYGEDKAIRFLKKKGLKIIERNYRTHFGEIDIVAEDADTLVFVEVKTRQSDRFGAPFEAVTERKRNRLRKLATLYLKQKRLDRPVRFDVISITAGNPPRIEHIKGAF